MEMQTKEHGVPEETFNPWPGSSTNQLPQPNQYFPESGQAACGNFTTWPEQNMQVISHQQKSTNRNKRFLVIFCVVATASLLISLVSLGLAAQQQATFASQVNKQIQGWDKCGHSNESCNLRQHPNNPYWFLCTTNRLRILSVSF